MAKHYTKKHRLEISLQPKKETIDFLMHYSKSLYYSKEKKNTF